MGEILVSRKINEYGRFFVDFCWFFDRGVEIQPCVIRCEWSSYKPIPLLEHCYHTLFSKMLWTELWTGCRYTEHGMKPRAAETQLSFISIKALCTTGNHQLTRIKPLIKIITNSVEIRQKDVSWHYC